MDDALCINVDAVAELEKLDGYFKMKPGSIGDPDIYLGGKLRTVIMEDPNTGLTCEAWGLSPTKYVQAAIDNVEEYLAKNFGGRKLPKKCAKAPFASDYRPELDLTPELDPTLCSYYQSQIGILRWMVELGRVDIITEVSELSSHLALPREGHLEAVFRIYLYLKYKKNTLMVYEPSYPTVSEDRFPRRDWNNFYGEVKELLPPLMPKPLGAEVIMRVFVDVDYAGDSANRRSRIGFVIFLNEAPIAWYSKKQSILCLVVPAYP